MQDVYKSASTQPAYTGTTFTSNTTGINNQFDQNALDSYMNPYLSTILNPQLAEARRNAAATQMKTSADLIRQGAFGGGRQAIASAENARNMNDKLADITGKGYGEAYTAAQAQYNADQNRLLDALKEKEKSGQFTSNQGLNYLKLAGETAQDQGTFGNQLADKQLAANRQMAEMGGVQRDIEQQGLTADKKQFEEQQAYPFNMVEFQRKLVEGLPTGASTTAVNQDAVSKMQSDVAGLASLYKTLANLGVK
jgi:hypothetical protein